MMHYHHDDTFRAPERFPSFRVNNLDNLDRSITITFIAAGELLRRIRGYGKNARDCEDGGSADIS